MVNTLLHQPRHTLTNSFIKYILKSTESVDALEVIHKCLKFNNEFENVLPAVITKKKGLLQLLINTFNDGFQLSLFKIPLKKINFYNGYYNNHL